MIVPFSSGNYTVRAPIPQEPSLKQLKQNHNIEMRVYGCCYGISVNGDIKQGEGRNKHVLGEINANLSIRNQLPLPPRLLGEFLPYVLIIKNLITGEIYTKRQLPVYIYLSNFTGFGYINDYHKSWGPNRAIFFLRGFVDKIVF